jgi:hypothetical protein
MRQSKEPEPPRLIVVPAEGQERWHHRRVETHRGDSGEAPRTALPLLFLCDECRWPRDRVKQRLDVLRRQRDLEPVAKQAVRRSVERKGSDAIAPGGSYLTDFTTAPRGPSLVLPLQVLAVT